MELKIIRDGHLGGYAQGGDPATWCPSLWDWVYRRFQVRSMLDVGCGEAHSTRYFHCLGCDVLGVDGCRQALLDSVLPTHVALHDFCDGPLEPSRAFDLVWSCEFVEHVEQRYVAHVVDTMVRAADKLILLTHAEPGQEDGHHHVNCQSTRYWIEQFENAGFTCCVDSTLRARWISLADHVYVNHFARSGLVFLHPRLAPEARFRQASPAFKAAWIRQRFRLSARLVQHRCRRFLWKRLKRFRSAA